MEYIKVSLDLNEKQRVKVISLGRLMAKKFLYGILLGIVKTVKSLVISGMENVL